MSFLTVHIMRDLPMHNLNRDQNGLPKSQFDGGIQRARISSQAIKRPTRIAFRQAIAGLGDAPGSMRTMDTNAIKVVVSRAHELAAHLGHDLDAAVAKKQATAVVRSLAKASKERAGGGADAEEAAAKDAAKKDNILLFSEAEFDTLAQALVDAQADGPEPGMDNFIQDFRSPSLDIAAFGRMFAARADRSTQAAVAVSHAITTHEMSLTIDYFTAVDDFEDDHERTDAGAAHLGLAYYTSGVYYSTFTIDPGQLARSWSAITAPTAHQQLVALIKCLVTALPTGKLTNTNAHTVPFLVLAEDQRARAVYGFETPVMRGRDGGYKATSVAALVDQMSLARSFDERNYRAAAVFAPEFAADMLSSAALSGITEFGEIDALASWVADRVLSVHEGQHGS